MNSLKKTLASNKLVEGIIKFAKDNNNTLEIQTDTFERYFMLESGDVLVDEEGEALPPPEGSEWSKLGFGSVDVNVLWFVNLKTKEGRASFTQAIKGWVDEDLKYDFPKGVFDKLVCATASISFSDKDYSVIEKVLEDSLAVEQDHRDVWVGRALLNTSIFSTEFKSLMKTLEEEEKFDFFWAISPFSYRWNSWVFVIDTLEMEKFEYVQKKLREEKNFSYDKVKEEVAKISDEHMVEVLAKSKDYQRVGELFIEKMDPTCMVSLYPSDLRDGYSKAALAMVVKKWFAAFGYDFNILLK